MLLAIATELAKAAKAVAVKILRSVFIKVLSSILAASGTTSILLFLWWLKEILTGKMPA
jgi:hypothetical protein